MAITYDAPSDTITVTAGTAGAPNTFTDIYNADVAGGWGQVTKTGNMFVFSAKLQVGDGSTATYLHDTFKKVTLNEIWAVKNNAELKTGTQVGGHPRKGCFLVLNTTSATAINVESGGTFYRYQTPAEDTGTGVNAIVGDTEDFYRGVQIIDLDASPAQQYIGFGSAEDKAWTSIFESIWAHIAWIVYPIMPQIYRYKTDTGTWQMAGMAFTDVEPGVGLQITVSVDCCLIVDDIDDAEYYNRLWSAVDVKWRFDVPAGGTCGGLTRTPRTLYVMPDK